MSGKKENKKKKAQPAAGEPEVVETPAPPTPEEIEALQLRVVHMFEPHAGDPLMRRLEDLVHQIVAEGRTRG